MKTRVLLVDDEKQFVEVLSQRLMTREFEVLTAFNGDEALEVLEKANVDVVVLDVMMPLRDGVSTLREIKLAYPLVEVIMLTGNSTVDDAIEGMKLGAFDYLLKPTDTSDLVEKLNKATERKKEQDNRIRSAEMDRIIKTKD